MAYMLLIAEPIGERGAEAGKQVHAQMLGFAEDLKTCGILRGVESLATDTKGARIQVRNGRTSRIDGPFTKAKEMIGGFFIVDVATREEAFAIAAACPAAAWATIEVRETGPCWA